MARPLRIEQAGGWYHVSSRGNERKSIYQNDRDRERFLELLAEMVWRFRIGLHGYVLMDNHDHLLLELSRYLHLNPVRIRALGLSKTQGLEITVWWRRTAGGAKRAWSGTARRKGEWSRF
jgi:REP element-mobilizing transposase RayT